MVARQISTWFQTKKKPFHDIIWSIVRTPLCLLRLEVTGPPTEGSWDRWLVELPIRDPNVESNISSFHLHGTDLLQRATKAVVHLLASQETNVTSLSAPSVSNICQRRGWPIVQIPKPNRNRGGVALLLLRTEPLHDTSAGQFSRGGPVHNCGNTWSSTTLHGEKFI